MEKKKSVEETYRKLSQIEHIKHRPGMYTGSIKKQLEEMWIVEADNIKRKMINYSPGFLKIFDEILTNAQDANTKDTSVNIIKVDFNQETGEISVFNNGKGIPVVIHKEHNIYVPELIFGHLLSGSNYDDNLSRTGSGINGLGSKLTNIFSKSFTIETVDSENKLKFVQEYKENLNFIGKPTITKNSGKSYVKVSFIPDYKRFNMEKLDDQVISLLKRRVYDSVVCTPKTTSIYLNGEKLKAKGLLDYIKFFKFESEKVFYDCNENENFTWEWAVVPSKEFNQVSFVNGNNTMSGGTHVNYILNQITSKLKVLIEKRQKIKEVKTSFIKERLFLFLRATVKNPTFNSQTKETLTTQFKDFGCSFQISDKYIDKLYKSSITEDIVKMCKLKENMDLAKSTDGNQTKRVFIDKLEDANLAGTRKSMDCSLFLTEGLSASKFAKDGKAIIGNDYYGVYPLKGKCISENTKIPLWNGNVKSAKDVKIGDELIGDDGNKRRVLTLFKGKGKMYRVSQDRGESYKVNDEHILTVCFPLHKSSIWYDRHTSWKVLYWNKELKCIKLKEFDTFIKVQCYECGESMCNKSLSRHYTRRHKNLEFKMKKTNIDMNDIKVLNAKKKMEEFLKTIDDNNIIDISIKDFLNISKSFRNMLGGIRSECVNWKEQDVLLDPYMLGLWLGDGSANGYSISCYGEKDVEIIDYLNSWGENNDAKFSKGSYGKVVYNISSLINFRKKGEAPLKKVLSEYKLINNKHIPKDYLVNSEEIRLKLLAGIIDTDGYVCKDGTIEISQSVELHTQLALDIIYLARSLGFYTHVKIKTTNYVYTKNREKAEAYIIKISGDTKCIPTLLPRNKSTSTNQYKIRKSTGPLTIKEIPSENYVGIGIDGNNRFLINDFTVTHNCLNIRDATTSQLINNEEINHLKQIIGLKQGVVYDQESIKKLRYGKIIILTDSDVDGTAISALIMNIFHFWWPELIKLGFIQKMITPIVRAFNGKNTTDFYTLQDFNKYIENNTNKSTKYKYYKGLGTWEQKECKKLFENGHFKELLKQYIYVNEECDNAMKLAFEKTKEQGQLVSWADKRKEWLSKYDKSVYIKKEQKRISLKELVNNELIHFSVYDNLRSIPHYVDGLKPSQRKILYYMLKKNITQDLKVAQLSGYVSAETSYHHGEMSLQKAIIAMAQNFIGSNNVNLLYPAGNFGSRNMNGADAASPRYTFTRLSLITRLIFNQQDDELLNYLEDDGTLIEPEYFEPIIPMLLVNGSEGIGTGYSTYIPSYNILEIIDNLLFIIKKNGDVEDSTELKTLVPYYENFKGEIEADEENKGIFKMNGIYNKIDTCKIKITELPVNVHNYKAFLENKIQKQTKNSIVIKDYINNTRDDNIDIEFIIEFKDAETLNKMIKNGTLNKELKLTSTISTNNMYVFDENTHLVRYTNPNNLLLDFYDHRIDIYEKRRLHLMKKLKDELLINNNKIRFISEYLSNKIQINKKTKDQLIEQLKQRKYDTIENSFEYLYLMPMISLSKEKLDNLTDKINKLETELKYYRNTTNLKMWEKDLLELKQNLK